MVTDEATSNPFPNSPAVSKMAQNPIGGRKIARLWKSQDGACPVCRQSLRDSEAWHVHHIRPKHAGGGEEFSNRVLLHENCHMQVHSSGLKDAKPVPRQAELKGA